MAKPKKLNWTKMLGIRVTQTQMAHLSAPPRRTAWPWLNTS